MADIPTVDFSGIQLDEPVASIERSKLEDLSVKLGKAFKTVGFAYIQNHGITSAKVAEVNRIAKEFLTQPIATKQKYQYHGWDALEKESLNPVRPGDLKEAYNVNTRRPRLWPDHIVPNFKSQMLEFYSLCEKLSKKILYLMAMALNLKDEEIFTTNHQNITGTTLRCLYYPPLLKNFSVKPNQVRCGEHSDYGSITLLFQDLIGGLEVKLRNGEWIPAKPIPGSILINIGDLMQRWTGDTFVSTKHRILIPEEQLLRNQGRQSIAFFAHPDDDCLVEPVDGSKKYEPINTREYVKMRYAVTF